MCAHHNLSVAKAFCMPVTVDCSVADRFLPEPYEGSNSKEKLQTAEEETTNNYKLHRIAKTET